MPKRSTDPLFIVKLQKGLADRKRLPLAHVLSVLDELRQLVAEVGRGLQRRRGTPHPTGDFGLEIIAGDHGIAFQGGSVQASIAITERPGTGIKAIQSIIDTVDFLGQEDSLEQTSDRKIDSQIVRRLSRIAKIQKSDHTEMNLGIWKPGQTKPSTATFGAVAIATVKALQAPTFRVDGSFLYGRLFHLLDRTTVEDEGDEEKGFWGELRTDTGEIWRVQFRPSDIDRVTGLFRQRVRVTGTAVHYRIAHPKLICTDIQIDQERESFDAYEQLYGCNKAIYKADLQTILKSIRGED